MVSRQDVEDETPLPADWPQTTEVLVSRCQAQLDRLDGVEAEAIYGGPREELARLGGEVDLLIVGSRSYGPVHRMFLGTTSTYLTRHIGCPLLVLPRRRPVGGGRRDGAGVTGRARSRPPEPGVSPARGRPLIGVPSGLA